MTLQLIQLDIVRDCGSLGVTVTLLRKMRRERRMKMRRMQWRTDRGSGLSTERDNDSRFSIGEASRRAQVRIKKMDQNQFFISFRSYNA